MRFTIILFITLFFNNQTVNAALLADYVFEDNLSGNVANSPDIEYLGNTLSFEPGMIQGYPVKAVTIDSDTGLNLDLSQWNLCDTYSIVVHGYLDDVTSYKKLIDFRSLSGDPGFYSNNGKLAYVVGQTALETSILDDIYFQLVVTRDGNDLVSAYIDGELQFSFTDSSSGVSMCASDSFYFFVDDLATNTESPQGAIARVTLYDHSLTDDEVGELEILDIIFATDFETIELP